MKNRKIFRVLAAVPLFSASGRKILNGIHRFLGEGYAWDIELVRRDNEFLHLFEEGQNLSVFDGMIVAFGESREIRQRQAALNLPTVFIDHPDPMRSKLRHRVFVQDDEKSIAAAAAQHLLLSHEHKSYGFVPTRDYTPWSERRQQAFVKKMSVSGKTVSCYVGSGNSRDELIGWIQDQPKPMAILAAFDDRAIDILEACRAAKLSVPNDVAVLGIGNDEFICEMAVPPLSSVAVDFESQGYRAARELQALMLGGANPKSEISYGARGTIRRASTPGRVPAAALVQRAMDFIRKNALKGITSRDVANHLHVSRRLADLRFGEVRGTTMLKAIVDMRINEAKRLLAESNMDLDQIAESCGYRNTDVMRVLFKRHTGLSPRAWRKRAMDQCDD